MSALSEAVNELRLAAANLRAVREDENCDDQDESTAIVELLDAVDDVVGAW